MHLFFMASSAFVFSAPEVVQHFGHLLCCMLSFRIIFGRLKLAWQFVLHIFRVLVLFSAFLPLAGLFCFHIRFSEL